MRGDDQRYYGPTEIRSDPSSSGFTKDKQVIKEISENNTGFQYRAFSDPLSYYHHHEYITPQQFRAGARFGSLWHHSILRVRYVRSRYGEVTGDADLESIALAPRDYLNAYAAIQGEYERKMVVNVCCHGIKAGPRKGMRALKGALDDLRMHFKLQRQQEEKHEDE